MRRISASSSSNGGDRLSGRLAAHADDRSWGNKPCGRPVVHPSDTLFGRLSAHPSGKPCDDTRTGSSQTLPSPDRVPLHLTTIPARVQAEAAGGSASGTEAASTGDAVAMRVGAAAKLPKKPIRNVRRSMDVPSDLRIRCPLHQPDPMRRGTQPQANPSSSGMRTNT